MAPRIARGLPSRVALRIVDGRYVGNVGDVHGDVAARASERYFGAQRVARDNDAALRRVTRANDESSDRRAAPTTAATFVPLSRGAGAPSARSTAANPASADSDDEAEGETLAESAFRRAKQFNERLRVAPHDVDQWLAFAAFQERFVAAQGRPAPGAVDDKRIAVLQAALRDNGDDERLLLAYLQACERRWDVAALEQLWQRFLAQFPDSAHLWLSYIAFRGARFADFALVEQRRAYADALAALARARRVEPDELRIRHLETASLSVLVKYVVMERHAGYVERAIGCLQVIE